MTHDPHLLEDVPWTLDLFLQTKMLDSSLKNSDRKLFNLDVKQDRDRITLW